MDGTNPKISFIPKGSLVREESFLERSRPRSMAGLLAIALFIISIGSYVGFYFYNDSLEKDIVSMTEQIKATQETFSNAPQVWKAQLFSSRAKVAKELLGRHTVVSPTFTFISNNTIESILYDKFSFAHSIDGSKVELTGEAPTYAALAYQGDVFRNKEELLNFTISNISLTQFGTILFKLTLTFTPDYLAYAKSLSSAGSNLASALEVVTSPAVAPVVDTSSPQEVETPPVSASMPVSDTGDVAISSPTTTTKEVVAPTEKQSVLRSIWLRFKFW